LEQTDQFRVYRLKEQDILRLERSLPSSKNAYGKPEDSYHLQDTLTSPGSYLYRVLGYPQDGPPVLITEVRISYVKKKKPPPVSQTIVIDPPFNQRVEYAVRVYETEQLSVIHAINGIYDPAKPASIEIDMKGFIAGGQRTFMVVLINKATQETKEFYYRVDSRGSVIED
jgi:23S rRNA A2030 N6-methylase RlmJ